MEGVAGFSRPADGSFRGAGQKPVPSCYLPVENAPLRRKGLRAVEFPQLHRPIFPINRMR